MILADTSAWVEFRRATESPTHTRLRAAIEAGETLATTGTVILELLAGARDEIEAADIRRMLAHCRLLKLQEPLDQETAAALYRACRREGATVRRVANCLIAAVAVRTGARLLHRDADFDVIARYSALRIEPT